MKHQKKLFPVIAGFFGIILLTTGCSAASGSGSTPSASGEPQKLKIVVSPVADAAVLYLAKEKGIFEDHNLDVELTVGQGGSAVAAALQTGEADLGLVNYVTLFSGRANNLPLKVAAPLSVSAEEEAGLYVSPTSGLSTLEDLKGKRFGLVNPGSVADLTTSAALATVDLTAKDIEYVQVPLANLVASVTTSQVDFIFMQSPFSLQAEAAGLKKIHAAFSGEAGDLPSAGVAASEKWIESHSATLKAFRAAVSEAADLANGDESLVRAVLPSYSPLDAEKAKVVPIPAFVSDLSHDEIQRIPDLMVKFGFLEKDIDASTAVAW